MLFTLLIYTKCNYVYSVTYPACHGIKQVDGYFRLAERIDGILPSKKIANTANHRHVKCTNKRFIDICSAYEVVICEL